MDLNLTDRLGNVLLTREIEVFTWSEVEKSIGEVRGQCKNLAGILHFDRGNVQVDQFVVVCTAEEYKSLTDNDDRVPTFERQGVDLVWKTSAQHQRAAA